MPPTPPPPMPRELVNEGGDNDTLLSRYVWIYATPCPGCPLKIVYQPRVRPVAPPLLLHRVDQIILQYKQIWPSLFARVPISRGDHAIYRWYINQTNWTCFKRVIDRQRPWFSMSAEDRHFALFLLHLLRVLWCVIVHSLLIIILSMRNPFLLLVPILRKLVIFLCYCYLMNWDQVIANLICCTKISFTC